MSSLESNKNLAGIGSILLMFPVLSIVGIILIFIGIKGLSEYYKDDSIYRNAIMGVVFGIIGLVALAIGVIAVIVSGMLSSLEFGPVGAGFRFLLGLLLLIVVFIFFVLMTMYFRRAFNSLAQRSGEHLFETAGTWLFYGAVLIIMFGIGFIIMFVAWIMATIAFFSIKAPSQTYVYGPPPTAAPTTQATRFCPNCGAPVDANATFCPHCGKQLPPT